MIWHHFKYGLLGAVRVKMGIFWTLLFPIALVTFMYLAFGNLTDAEEVFHKIPVAYVSEDASDPVLLAVLRGLSEGEDALLSVKEYDRERAMEALTEEEVLGIVYGSDGSLVVMESSYRVSILENILTQYKQQRTLMVRPAQHEYVTEVSLAKGKMDWNYNYYYAVFAMSCLFSGMSSLFAVVNLKGSTSALGLRRSVAPVRKMQMILGESAALLLIHFVIELIAFGYMRLLGIEFDGPLLAFFGILLCGCLVGLGIGALIGSLRYSSNVKLGIFLGTSMTASVLSDLCIGGLKNFIEHHCPIVNRLNPAALIADSFCALNVFEGYARYARNMSFLLLEVVVLYTVCYFVLRRNRYESV